ncbi:hypothetical protein FQN60_010597, partial [Etheostoma spectabile]
MMMTRSYHHHHHPHRTAARRSHLPPCHHAKPDEEKSVNMRSCWTRWRRLTISSCSSTKT